MNKDKNTWAADIASCKNSLGKNRTRQLAIAAAFAVKSKSKSKGVR